MTNPNHQATRGGGGPNKPLPVAGKRLRITQARVKTMKRAPLTFMFDKALLVRVKVAWLILRFGGFTLMPGTTLIRTVDEMVRLLTKEAA